MTDNDASPSSQNPAMMEPDGGHGSRNRHSMASYETGESSNPLGLRPPTSTTDSTLAPRSTDDAPSLNLMLSRIDHTDRGDEPGRKEQRRSHRAQKQRLSGSFLLSDALDEPTHDHSRSLHRRRNAPDAHKPKKPAHAAEKLHVGSLDQPGSSSRQQRDVGEDGGQITQYTTDVDDEKDVVSSLGAQGTAVMDHSPAKSGAAYDMDSAQIVSMALNLSESRRLAAKRNVSQPLPPRLAPLPDSTVGGSLRQQLQQQRRTSRTISPKPERGSRPGAAGQRISSPLQAAFEPLQDGIFRYHFSQSTLARAQKAKDYMELLTQYRRVLDLVPPLKPASAGKVSATSPPSTAASSSPSLYFGSGELVPSLGRPYNPLQYIRNRRVRTRERKAIDGEAQGFDDVPKVADWVDDVAKWAATGQGRTPGSALLPSFTSSEDLLLHHSPSTSMKLASTMAKPKRPRVDWVIDPADMLADIYWLEQEDNKKLVEDRYWRRVFPQDPELYIPSSRQRDAARPFDSNPESVRRKAVEDIHPDAVSSEHKTPPRGEHEHVLSTARKRARHKLQNLRGRHHRHSSSVNSYDFPILNKGSLSDSSDTDAELRRRNRTGTISATGKDILEKQMLEMIARENRDNELRSFHDSQTQRQKSTYAGSMTPEEFKPGDSPAPSRAQSKYGLRQELNESHETSLRNPPMIESPVKTGRASLEVPSFGRRLSVDYDSSRPTSPELRPSRRGTGFVPAIGADLSPAPSRPSSPSRNPFSKVKSIFRDRSRERTGDRGSEERLVQAGVQEVDMALSSPPSIHDRKSSRERRTSQSPLRKLTSRGTGESHKSHRSIGSLRLHGDESGSGLRGLLRSGPRIDTVLRSSVSKVSDLLWRKESAETADLESSSPSSDESEGELTRGRRRGPSHAPRMPSRNGQSESVKDPEKHYLDVMPAFKPTSGYNKQLSSHQNQSLSPISPQQRSLSDTRFDLLKPPKIDVKIASPNSTPPRQVRVSKDSDVSDVESRKSSYTKGSKAAGARLNAALSFPPPRPRQFSTATLAARPWTLSDRKPMPERAPLSRREVARLRALMLSSGILAHEISSRAKEARLLPAPGKGRLDNSAEVKPSETAGYISWADITKFSPGQKDLFGVPVAQTDFYVQAARILGTSIQTSGQHWQAAADNFSSQSTPALQKRMDELRLNVASDLSSMTRTAADEADDVSRDLVIGQRLKVRRVVDIIEKLLRRRRRRFRWVRRAGWLTVEWVLVGFMWYVWSVVMVARIFLGIAQGIFSAVKWLLWL